MGRYITIAILGALSALAVALFLAPGQKVPLPAYYQNIGREVIAQRGGAGLGPENTMAAAQLSLAAQADALEFDLWGLRDGALALIHDPDLARSTGTPGAIEVMTRSDLERFDAGYAFVDPRGARPFAGQSIHPPVLDDMLAAFPEARVFLEIKHDNLETAAALCTAVKVARAETRVMVASYFDAPLRAFRRECPAVLTALSPAEVKSFVTMQKMHLSRFNPLYGHAIVAPEVADDGMRVITPELVQAAHARGLRVSVYTIDAPEDMIRLWKMGVDGLITNRPDVAVQVRAELGLN
jgi:glycerophosphoryl diester phosphodiesterase